jgi:GT2 family glycosyltransferase
MKNKIGLGVITCNKPDRLTLSAPTIPLDKVDELVIINDGTPYESSIYPTGAEVIQHTKNMCVGPSKNQAMRNLLQKDCDHIFIMEDDVLIKRSDVFEAYIHAAEKSGIWHLNYALQGPANRKQDQNGPMNIQERGKLQQSSEPNPRAVIDYDGIDMAFYPNSVGAFSYFHKGVIKAIGYHDEKFKNCWEHVEHTYRIIKAGLHPPFWWFADRADSQDYLGDVPNCIEESTIAHTPDWIANFQSGMAWYKNKHGWTPQETPQQTPEQLLASLEQIKKNYARVVL